MSATEIKAKTITAGQIAAGAISASEIAIGGIDGTRIAQGSIETKHLKANIVTAGKILLGDGLIVGTGGTLAIDRSGFTVQLADASLKLTNTGLKINIGAGSPLSVTATGIDVTGIISADHISSDVRNAVVLAKFSGTRIPDSSSRPLVISLTESAANFSSFLCSTRSVLGGGSGGVYAPLAIPKVGLSYVKCRIPGGSHTSTIANVRRTSAGSLQIWRDQTVVEYEDVGSDVVYTYLYNIVGFKNPRLSTTPGNVTPPSPTPTITRDTDTIWCYESSDASDPPSGGQTARTHTPSGCSRSALSADTTRWVYKYTRTRTYTNGSFTSATAWGNGTQVHIPTSGVITDTDEIWCYESSDASDPPSGGLSIETHTPADCSRVALSSDTTRWVYKYTRTRTYTDGNFTSATAWGNGTRVRIPTGGIAPPGSTTTVRANAGPDVVVMRPGTVVIGGSDTVLNGVGPTTISWANHYALRGTGSLSSTSVASPIFTTPRIYWLRAAHYLAKDRH